MGIVVALALALVAFGLIFRFGRPMSAALQLTGAALLIALAGYFWQGRPSQVGRPARPAPPSFEANEALSELRRELNGERFGYDSQYLDYADTALRYGAPQVAVRTIKRGLRDNPRSAALWTGLGNALLANDDGLLSPAAEFAFLRAHELSPEHPGPPFFYGLALAQNDEVERAARVWRRLLARTSAKAPWRPKLVALIERAKGDGVNRR